MDAAQFIRRLNSMLKTVVVLNVEEVMVLIKVKAGDRVRLFPEHFLSATGTAIEVSDTEGTCLVKLDKEYHNHRFYEPNGLVLVDINTAHGRLLEVIH
jgi:hypothetical protein